MQYRRLGQSEFDVSVLSFGAWQLGDPEYWGGQTEGDAECRAEDAECRAEDAECRAEDAECRAEDAAAAVGAALDAGINLFDTAEGYGDGESERALGKALGKRRDEVFIASKVSSSNCAPARLRASCEASLQRLNSGHIDLYQVHWPCRDVPFEDTYGEMARLQDEGKIREIGVSNFGKADLEAWLSVGAAVSDQLGYNMAFRAVEYEIVPACRKHKVGVLVYMPLMQGLLTGRWESVPDVPLLRRRTRHFSKDREGTRHGERGCEGTLMEMVGKLRRFAEAIGMPTATVSLYWLVAQPGVTSAIVGARNTAQVRHNMEAADLDLGPAGIAQLNEISGPLKSILGGNADMWQSGEEARIQ